MSRAEFWVCAGSDAGGKALANHFAYRLESMTGRRMVSFDNNNIPGKLKVVNFHNQSNVQKKNTKIIESISLDFRFAIDNR